VISGNEFCEGADLGGLTCSSFGFDSGELSCDDATCLPITSACTGTERCFDALDNDGDRAVDCADPDCAADCSDSCAHAVALTLPASLSGLTTGHAQQLDASCSRTPSGSEVVYVLTPPVDGTLSASWSGTSGLTASLRSDCSDGATEMACSGSGLLSAAVTGGQPVYLVLEGASEGDEGAFELAVELREPACGDYRLDPGESCDDGNVLTGDGCDASCHLESSETGPNNTAASAEAFRSPFFGEISQINDGDYMAVSVTEPLATLTAFTTDFGGGQCASGALDSMLSLKATDGMTTLVADDDGGDGFCSRIDYQVPTAGTYYLRVGAAAEATVPFVYILRTTVQLCGNGITSPGEDCDDGNRDDGDGCSSSCTSEW